MIELIKYIYRRFHVSADLCKFGIYNCGISRYCLDVIKNTINGDTMQWNFNKVKLMGSTTVICKDMTVVT